MKRIIWSQLIISIIGFICNNSMLLDKFWPSNGLENSVYSRSNNVISKYVHGFEYRSNADEIQCIVVMLIILNFLEFDNSCSRKFKIITIPITGHISSVLKLHLNPSTYLETAASNPSYTAFSVWLDEYNLCKKHWVMMHETSHVIAVEYVLLRIMHNNPCFLDRVIQWI